MNLELAGKIAIVGGASQGIGRGIARTLANEGATVILTARRQADLDRAAEEIAHDFGIEAIAIAADCRRAEDCVRVVDMVVERFGGIDIVVNNDGAPPLGAIHSFDDEAWRRAVDQNLMYVVRMVRSALPHIRDGGSILNITAISAIQPVANFGLSVATWAGVIGYAKTLSIEVAPRQISVNTICPGYIETARLEKVFAAGGEDPAAMREALIREVPMRRLGSVNDIANCVAFLVSERGRYITGTSIPIDGGLLRAVR